MRAEGLCPTAKAGRAAIGTKTEDECQGGEARARRLDGSGSSLLPPRGKWPKADRGNSYRTTPLPVQPPPCGGGRQERSAVLPGEDTDSRESPTVSRLAGDRRLPPPPMGGGKSAALRWQRKQLASPLGGSGRRPIGGTTIGRRPFRYRAAGSPVPPPPAGEARAQRPPLRRGKVCGKIFSPPLFRTKKLCYNR